MHRSRIAQIRLVTPNAHATRILVENGRAAGVAGHFVDIVGRKKRRMTVRAPIVLVAGGASETPALLMRSGVRAKRGSGRPCARRSFNAAAMSMISSTEK